MANYTATKLIINENKGDSIFHNNMQTSGSITITPNEGYVVSASSFSISTLPTGIASVVFSDTATAGTVNNTVTALATFSSDFVASANQTIFLNISGDAEFFKEENKTISISAKIIDNTNANKFATSTFTNITSATTSTSNGIKSVSFSESTNPNKLTNAGEIKVTASSGYYFKDKPYLLYKDSNNKYIKIKPKSIVRNSNGFFARGSKGLITEYTFNIFVKSDISRSISDVNLVYSAEKLFENKKEIISFSCGQERYIPSRGTTKTIVVKGSPGSEFSIAVLNSSDNNIIPTSLQNDTAIVGDLSGVPVYTKTIPKSLKPIEQCVLTLDFPAVSSDIYSIHLIPKPDTVVSSSVNSVIKIKQLQNPVITFTAGSGTSRANLAVSGDTSVQITGRPGFFAKNIDGLSRNVNFTITMTASGGTSFTTGFTTPTFSQTNQSNSSWTNSIKSSSNNNNLFSIKDITVSGYTGHSTVLTVTFKVSIHRFGDGNITCNLDTDNIALNT